MYYELWDTDSGNIIGSWDNLESALNCVNWCLGNGWSPDELSLGEEPDGEVWYGEELLERIK